jgi:hypothetical protein
LRPQPQLIGVRPIGRDMGIDAELHMTLHCALAEDQLFIRHMSGGERLGTCFEYVLRLKYRIRVRNSSRV